MATSESPSTVRDLASAAPSTGDSTFDRADWIKIGLIVSIPAVIWGQLILKLRTDWSTNPQYEFGFFVPFFILYLLARRWASRPDASPPRSMVPIGLFGASLLAIQFPLRIVQEANPDWRPLNWLAAGVAVGCSLTPLMLIGGWRWVRHFTFPFLLIFSALPWPLAMEQGTLQALSGAVTIVTVELLNLFGIPALQRGNVIDMAMGSVGIADACSGIRSLAGTLMASIFFGEFYRLETMRRLGLVVGGCLAAFALNLCRALFLSWRAATDGIHSIDKWHDPAGFGIFLISFSTLWLLAALMSSAKPDNYSYVGGNIRIPKMRYNWVVCSLIWVLASEAICESWYRYREGMHSSSATWDMRWPQQSASFQFVEVPSETLSILRYTSGQSAVCNWGDGSSWRIFFFHWAPGRASVQLATMHRPEVCMPAVGYKFVATAEPLQLTLASLTLPFSGSVFDSGGGRVYVYRCLWEDFPIDRLRRNKDFDMSVSGRMLGAWYGRRNLGQRMLQVAMVGLRSEEEAKSELTRKLSEMIALKG